jgi:small multidrug resistance pump
MMRARRMIAAAGIALVAVLSIPLFGETLSAVQAGGMALIIAGAVTLEAGTSHA